VRAVLAPEELLAYCERALRACEVEGAEEAEAFVLARATTEVKLDRREGRPSLEGTSTSRLGLAIRVYRDGRLGFSYTTDLSEGALREVIRSTLKAARPLEGFRGFPTPRKAPGLRLFDAKVADLTEEECMERLLHMVEAVECDEGLEVSSATFGTSIIRFGIANSGGLETWDEGTFVRAMLAVSARGAPGPTPASAIRRRLTDLDVGQLARDVAQKAKLMSKAEAVEAGKVDVVLSPWALAELLAYAFSNALRADNVRSGTSVLKGKLGQRVASNCLSIYDDPTHQHGICSFGIDDEGTPAERKAIIEGGELKGFLYDSIEAGRQGLEKAGGNCIRWEPPAVDPYYPRDYRFRPGIYPTNLLVEPGRRGLDDLLSELDSGLYAYASLAGFAMRPSGDFSLYVLCGFKVEGGELAGGLKGFNLRGNVFELVKAIKSVGSNLEPVVPEMAGFCVIAPHVLVEGVEVVG